MMFKTPLSRWVAALTLALCGSVFAQAKKEVTFAHQDMLVPLRTVMESGELEKATGYKINWRMFGGGGDVIKAMASGDVQIGEAGSSPLTAAAIAAIVPIVVLYALLQRAFVQGLTVGAVKG